MAKKQPEKKETTPQPEQSDRSALIMSKPLSPTDGRIKLDFRSACRLMLAGQSDYQIAKILGVTQQCVINALAPLRKMLAPPELVAAYKDNYVNMLTKVKIELLAQLSNEAKIKEASLNNVAYAFSQVTKELRLETGQATSIFSVSVHEERERQLEEIDKELQELEAEYELLDDGNDDGNTGSITDP